MKKPILSLSLFLVSLLLGSCGSLGGAIDQPSPAAVRAEASTFDVVAPALFDWIEFDAVRPIETRMPPAGRPWPEGRTDAELANMLGLLDDWAFRIAANAEGAGIVVDLEIPLELVALKEALLAGALSQAIGPEGE
jgi:hypothetical protein